MRKLLIACFALATIVVLLFTFSGGEQKQSQGSPVAPKSVATVTETPETQTSTGEKEVTGQIGLSLAPLREQ